MPYPKFTKVIIHHFLSQHKSISKRQGSRYIIVDNDGVLERLKFISKGGEHQVYGKPMPDILVTDDIQNSEAYKTFISLSTGSIPPKKGRGKGAYDEESYEQEERLIRRKPRGVVIQDTPRVSKKKSIDQSQKLKGIELLSDATRAGITPKVPDKPTRKSTVSNEGAGTSPKVLDETKDKNEKAKDILWVSTDEDESDDDDDEDNESIDIEKTDDEKTDTDVEDQVMGVAKINVAKKAEKEKADEEIKGDGQAADAQPKDDQVKNLDFVTHKDKSELLQSTFGHSLSSNFANQFLNNSPNASLISTISENAKVEINSLLDIKIQQEVPTIQQEPFHAVKVSVPDSEALTDVLQRVSDLEKDVKELKQVNHTPSIHESIKSQVPLAVDKYLGSSLGDTLQKIKQEHAANEKMPKFSTTPFDQADDDEYVQKDILFKIMMASKSYEKHPAHKALYDALIHSLLVDENDQDRLVVVPLSMKKIRHDDKDQDPPVGLDQGIKKRRTRKDVEPSKKSSKSKESAKGKTLSNTSKAGKSVYADKLVHELEHVVPMDVEDPNLDNVAYDANEPQADAIPKIPKQDWFKQPPRPKTLDPD
ncbi:hypothetical protein Tco_0992230 [Tanacetum coccineum]|uniref:Uncharacterized protein n=1 Tax=Tanacetum coccineum TaxID=301880 RepID=A0ABQ5F1G5_9ASTR